MTCPRTQLVAGNQTKAQLTQKPTVLLENHAAAVPPGSVVLVTSAAHCSYPGKVKRHRCFHPTFRVSDLIGLGCNLGSGILFKKLPGDSNM